MKTVLTFGGHPAGSAPYPCAVGVGAAGGAAPICFLKKGYIRGARRRLDANRSDSLLAGRGGTRITAVASGVAGALTAGTAAARTAGTVVGVA
jgi:hypothetical protein